VVLDPGNVIVSVVLPVTGIGGNKKHFARLSAWLIAGLAQIGFEEITPNGISDLVLGDRKVAGSCIYRSKEILYYSASLLVAPEVELMERYLEHPPREPEYRRGRSHADFVRGLEPSPDAEAVLSVLRGLATALDLPSRGGAGRSSVPRGPTL
jgi:lipoate-protein ligase A